MEGSQVSNAATTTRPSTLSSTDNEVKTRRKGRGREGGLVIRSFQDVAKAMRMKMAWKLVTETSLWSTFFKQKYMQNIHPWYASNSKRPGCSKLWTEIASVMRSILLNSKWLIGNGNSTSFWYDNWFADCPLIEFALESPEDSPNVAEFVDPNGEWNFSSSSSSCS